MKNLKTGNFENVKIENAESENKKIRKRKNAKFENGIFENEKKLENLTSLTFKKSTKNRVQIVTLYFTLLFPDALLYSLLVALL